MSDPWIFRHHIVERVLPGLARLDGIGDRVEHVRAVFDALTGDDLAFDLRRGPAFASNLCAENAALELGVTFGRDRTGVRYQFEPTCARRMLKNRYTLFRDRMSSTMRALDEGYDATLFRQLWAAFIGADVALNVAHEATATIAAVHHYPDRPPRLKAYFGCDYEGDAARSFAVAARGLALVDDDAFASQVAGFRAAFAGGGVARMVGFDFEPGRATEAKLYLASDGLDRDGLARLVALAGGGAAEQRGVDELLSLFVHDGADAVGGLNLLSLGLERGGAPRLKIYVRPVEHHGDGETLRRLAPWFAAAGREGELAHVERALALVTPLDVLDETRGFFNYVSVDVSARGLEKTSVYFTPQIPLMHLARTAPDRLKALLD